MSIKILGGKAKGMNLFLPDEKLVRPTLVLLKRRIFDSFQNLEGATFVDGCAGSGSMGLEAWSRGCEEVFFVEDSKRVTPTLKKNVAKVSDSFGNPNSLNIIEAPFEKYIFQFKSEYEAWEQDKKENTIIFLDPPYQMIDFYKKIINELSQENWFVGQLWIESDEKIGVAKSYWEGLGLEVFRTYAQGHSYILVVNF